MVQQTDVAVGAERYGRYWLDVVRGDQVESTHRQGQTEDWVVVSALRSCARRYDVDVRHATAEIAALKFQIQFLCS